MGFILLWAFSGCTTVTYRGDRPLEEVATIEAAGAYVVKFDGKAVASGQGRLQVPPGVHTLEVVYKAQGMRSLTSVPVRFLALPGHTYVTDGIADFAAKTWQPTVSDKEYGHRLDF